MSGLILDWNQRKKFVLLTRFLVKLILKRINNLKISENIIDPYTRNINDNWGLIALDGYREEIWSVDENQTTW